MVGVSGLLRTGQWCHITAVSGPGTMKLYFNGELVGTKAVADSADAVLPNQMNNWLGRASQSEGRPAARFRGAMAEVRVWGTARTPAQIQEQMFRRLSGSETGLLALWNFADGTARDVTGQGLDGELTGGARAVEASLPTAAELARPAVLFGVVNDPNGSPSGGVTVRLEQDGKWMASSLSRDAGDYGLGIYPGTQPYTLLLTLGKWGLCRTNLHFRPGEARPLNGEGGRPGRVTTRRSGGASRSGRAVGQTGDRLPRRIFPDA